jgi:hypothetical protein
MACVFPLSQDLFAQNAKVKNLPGYDDRALRYGFQLGVHQSRYNLRYNRSFLSDGDSTAGIYPKWTTGFIIGTILSLRISEHTNLRLVPNVTFYERNLLYTYVRGSETEQIVEQTFVEIPLLLKFKSARRLNHRFYMIGGISPNFKVSGKKERLDSRNLQTEEVNVELTYGFGMDAYFDMFKFAPEIRFSHGFTNMLIKNNNQFSRSLDRLTTHRVALIFNFE